MADASLGDAVGKVILDPSGVLSGMRRAQDAARTGFAGIGQHVQSVGATLSGLGTNLTMLMAPFAAVGGVGLKTFASFEDALAEIQARTGATADEMAKVQAKALEMGAATKYSATDAAAAMLQLLSSGYDLDETFAALPAVLDAAAAGALDLGYTADVVTDALAMWNMGADQAGRVADALARGAGASSAEINDLAQGLGNVGPMASQFGLSLEDTIAILAAFSERGIKGAEAGTQLRSMLTNMTRDTDKVTGAWKKLGINLYDVQGNMRPLASIMAEMRTGLAGLTQEERNQVITDIAGSYGQLGMMVLSSSPAMENMTALMAKQSDAATVAAARMGTLNGTTESLKGSIETLMITGLGPFVERSLKPAIRSVTEMVNKMVEWAAANPELTNQIAQVLAVLIGVGPVLLGIGKAISAVGSLIALATNPLGLLILVIGALYLAYKENFLGFKDFVDNTFIPAAKRLWEDVQPYLQLLYDWFVTTGLPAIKDFITNTAIPAVQEFMRVIVAIWEGIKPTLDQIFDWFVTTALPTIKDFILNTAIPAIQNFAGTIVDIWTKVSPTLSKIYDWFVTTALPTVRNFILNTAVPTIEKLVNAAKSLWDTAGPKLQSFYDFVMNNLSQLKSKVFDPIANAINAVWDAIGSLGDALGGLADKVPDWMIPGSPTPFEIGLRGIRQELDALSGAAMGGLSLTPALAGAGVTGGGVNNYFQISVPVSGETMQRYPQAAEYAREVASTLEVRLKSAQRWEGGGVARG